ncbi:hypothetical protein BDB00DRAFT_875790 [Zychaea mexicana]|uniref:uncharacterized protein n=1 Tax=Zychaea mexicana TaxID=64656 RepID=UPI0022FF260B|nr:uncharacterized protein BDB00DRAFT_875790 [Zychaea mexicana]KAI9489944.1 hypothetical protein BDB00DRAFT_875790 [Zychaea mexicana]
MTMIRKGGKKTVSPEGNDNTDSDMRKWLKEAEDAENLMDQVESRTGNLMAKVDALLAEMTDIQHEKEKELTDQKQQDGHHQSSPPSSDKQDQ